MSTTTPSLRCVRKRFAGLMSRCAQMLHHDVRRAVVHRAHVAHARDVLAADLHRRLRLAKKTAHDLGIARDARKQELDRDALVEHHVPCGDDDTHPSLAEHALDFVLAEEERSRRRRGGEGRRLHESAARSASDVPSHFVPKKPTLMRAPRPHLVCRATRVTRTARARLTMAAAPERVAGRRPSPAVRRRNPSQSSPTSAAPITPCDTQGTSSIVVATPLAFAKSFALVGAVAIFASPTRLPTTNVTRPLNGRS